MAKIGSPHILIATVQVPFTRGGAEVLVDNLKYQLEQRECVVDVIQLPFNAQPKESLLKQVALWRALDLSSFNGRAVDLVVATKFPSYMLTHPCKSLWLVHQHRQMYELYGSRFGDFATNLEDESLRQLLFDADSVALQECQARCTISANVSERLERYLGLDSVPLTPPLPLGNQYHSGAKGNYILSVGRICSIKRVDLIVKALPQIHEELTLKIVGLPDEPAIDTYLRSEIDKHHLWHRVEFLGRVGDQQLLELYANAFAVYYAPFDEDYGFVTLEALASKKPVVTARDSGGTLQFVDDEVNGLIVEPTEAAFAGAFNRLKAEEALYNKIVSFQPEEALTNTWDEVIAALLKPLESHQARVAPSQV